MQQKSTRVKAALWGGGISLLGTLPLGTLNIAAMQVSMAEGVVQGIYFSLGVALVEVLYVRLSVVGVRWIMQHARLLRYMEWGAVAVVLALAAGSFYAALVPGAQKSFVLQTKMPYFLLGISLSAINPMQIPFWFGWTTVLFSKGVLKHVPSFYNAYVGGIGTGTLLGLLLFVVGGNLLMAKLNAGQQLVNLIIGFVFVITAIVFMVKIGRKKSLDRDIAEKADALHKAETAAQ